MYELLTLEKGVTGETRQELLNQIESVDPAPARSIDRNIPVELETIIVKAIAKDPADRYQTAREFCDDLQRYLLDEPILARAPTLWEQGAKWIRRHEALTRSAIAVIVVALIALAITTFLVTRAQVRTQQAYEQEQAQRLRADRSAAQARQAVDYFTHVAADDFPKSPELIEIKEDLLRTAAAYYENFLSENKDDPKLANELTAARQNVSAILAELASVQELFRLMTDVQLLTEPSVQEDLHLSADQIKQAGALSDLSQLPKPHDDSDRSLSPQQVKDEFSGFIDKRRTALNTILSTAQFRRLREISRQLRGLDAWRDPDVADALALSDAQRDAIQKLRRRLAEHRPPPDPESGYSEEVEAIKSRRALSEAIELLAPVQRDAWATLTGAPFLGQVYLHHGPPGAHHPQADLNFERSNGN
jgi:hypothetical protein